MSRARGATSGRSGSVGRSQETGVDVEVVYRSFELDPTVPTGGDSPLLVDYLARKFGDRSRVQAAHARLTDAGAELGIDFRWSGCAGPTRSTPTGCSPGRCTSTGPDKQRAREAARCCTRTSRTAPTWPTTPCWPSWPRTSASTRRRPSALLASDDEADFVRAEREEAYGNGINAVPTFIVEGQWMLQGALDTDKWVKALTHIQAELAAQLIVGAALSRRPRRGRVVPAARAIVVAHLRDVDELLLPAATGDRRAPGRVRRPGA